MQGYWDRVLDRRISRRRAIAATGATAASAAFLAACGGDDDDGGGGGDGAKGDSSGLLYKLVDETKGAKHGGTYIGVQSNAPSSLDPHAIGAHGTLVARTYSQLFRIKDGVLQNTQGEVMGDLAQSWEISPDRLTLTIKLEPQAGFSPTAPMNGRMVDAEDIAFSWSRVERSGTLRGDLANSASPAAPILSITATDKSTVVVKLAEPNATIYTLLGHSGLGSLWIVGKEVADKVDPKGTAIGTGPYTLTDARTEVNLEFTKNPNFKRSSLKNNEPYIEKIQTPVIVDTAAISAQFRAGQVYWAELPQLEVVGAKRDNPKLLMYATDPPTTERVYFGHNEGSPFRDERLRQAFHRVIDRDTYVQAAYNTDKFSDEGLPVQEFWEGSFGQASWAGWLLDPKSKSDFGDAQKNFVFDVAEAKKLIEAAGHSTPFEVDYVRSAPGPTSFARPIYDRMEVMEAMLDQSGLFKRRLTDLNWATEWVPQVRNSGGKFVGFSWGPDTSSFDPAYASFFVYNPRGGYFEGGDATLEKMTLDIRAEFDVEKRKSLIRELQKYDAQKVFNQKLGVAGGFALVWPIVRNVGVYKGGTNWVDIGVAGRSAALNAWIDETQAPKGSA